MNPQEMTIEQARAAWRLAFEAMRRAETAEEREVQIEAMRVYAERVAQLSPPYEP